MAPVCVAGIGWHFLCEINLENYLLEPKHTSSKIERYGIYVSSEIVSDTYRFKGFISGCVCDPPAKVYIHTKKKMNTRRNSFSICSPFH